MWGGGTRGLAVESREGRGVMEGSLRWHGVNSSVRAADRGGLVFVGMAWSLELRILVARDAAQFGKEVAQHS